jgi:uncharacterized protein YjbI with pentapeptide repeats
MQFCDMSRSIASMGEPFERCEEPGCGGARLVSRHCLEHLTAEEFDNAVIRLCGGDPLDARATTISSERLDALLGALKDDDGRPALPAADFTGATFSGDAGFVGATFSGDAQFAGVTFGGTADFVEVTFGGAARFDGVTFGGAAHFVWATFSAYAGFAGVTFSAYAGFYEATFSGDAGFDRVTFSAGAGFVGVTFSAYAGFVGATFSAYADFTGATFSGYARFQVATFSRDVRFDGGTFGGYAGFVGVTFSGEAGFVRVTFSAGAGFVGAAFERVRQIGPLVVGERLVLDDCVFGERVTIEVAAKVVSARAATFAAGVHVRVRWAEIALDDADFVRPSTLSGAMTWRMDSDLQSPSVADERRIELEPRPRLVTLRGAHVAELSLSDVDLRACRFFGAHGLESLSIEGSCTWPHSPTTRRYSDRETIAEEHPWRGSGWEHPSIQPPQWLAGRNDPEQLQPAQVAALYRALRKAREDDKDQAGAGDLYYGEMEMRRRVPLPQRGQRGRVRARSDRSILTAYWLLCGYGLKASRALITLLLAVAAGSLGLWTWGFTPDPSYTRALLYSIESTSSLFRVPSAPGLDITYAGEGIQIALRTLGPVLIALAVLALRARVKR